LHWWCGVREVQDVAGFGFATELSPPLSVTRCFHLEFGCRQALYAVTARRRRVAKGFSDRRRFGRTLPAQPQAMVVVVADGAAENLVTWLGIRFAGAWRSSKIAAHGTVYASRNSYGAATGALYASSGASPHRQK